MKINPNYCRKCLIETYSKALIDKEHIWSENFINHCKSCINMFKTVNIKYILLEKDTNYIRIEFEKQPVDVMSWTIPIDEYNNFIIKLRDEKIERILNE